MTEIAKKICFKAGSTYSRLASNHVYSNSAIEKYEISDVEKRNYVFCGTSMTTVYGTKGSHAGLRQESSERKEEIARNE